MEPLVAEIERSFAEVERQLGDPELIADPKRYAETARRHKQLSRAHELAVRWRALTQQQEEAGELLDDADEEMRGLAQEQLAEARASLPPLEEELRLGGVGGPPRRWGEGFGWRCWDATPRMTRTGSSSCGGGRAATRRPSSRATCSA